MTCHKVAKLQSSTSLIYSISMPLWTFVCLVPWWQLIQHPRPTASCGRAVSSICLSALICGLVYIYLRELFWMNRSITLRCSFRLKHEINGYKYNAALQQIQSGRAAVIFVETGHALQHKPQRAKYAIQNPKYLWLPYNKYNLTLG